MSLGHKDLQGGGGGSLGDKKYSWGRVFDGAYMNGGMERDQISDIRPPKNQNIRYTTLVVKGFDLRRLLGRGPYL